MGVNGDRQKAVIPQRSAIRLGLLGLDDADQPRLDQTLDHRAIDQHGAQRCLPGLCRVRRQSVKADKVRWAEQYNARYALPCRGEPDIACRGNWSGIDLTRMRRDRRFRYGGNRCGSGAAEELPDAAGAKLFTYLAAKAWGLVWV